MAKLKNIIKQLSADDYQTLYDNLMVSNAEKSATLLKFIREKAMSDGKIMEELDVNTNAYYTLRSRLNQKIEEYLLQQIENPRTDLLKKVANVSEVVFTKKRAISVATLKKLEKELLDYDLANELTVVYKNLKKLHINTPESFQYSQLYNRHIAYMLALDKAEDLLAEYFKKYGSFTLTGSEIEKLELTLMYNEMVNVARLYQSHRLYVYMQCMAIFHRFFVETTEKPEDEPIEDILTAIEKIFETYNLDAIYFNLRTVFDFLKLVYYNQYKVYKKAEKYYEDVNEDSPMLLTNYSLYTYPALFLTMNLDRHLRLQSEDTLYEENKLLFDDYEADNNDVPKYMTYMCYRALCCFYSKHYNEAEKTLFNLLNDVNLKKFPQAMIEAKLLLSLQYCMKGDLDLFNQSINSIQRTVRMLDDKSEHVTLLVKLMKTTLSEGKVGKEQKLRAITDKLRNIKVNRFSPIMHIRLDDELIHRLTHDLVISY